MATAKGPISKARLRTLADEMFAAWNIHDVQAILDHLSDDAAWTDPSLGEPIRGKAAVRSHLEDMFSSFPDMHFLKEDFHLYPGDDEDAAIITWTMKATMTGSATETGIPATGKAVTISGTNLCRFSDGLISEYVVVYDSLYFLQQLGLLPKSDGLGFKAVVMADVMVGRGQELAGRAMKAVRR